jgi:hypothetical protein
MFLFGVSELSNWTGEVGVDSRAHYTEIRLAIPGDANAPEFQALPAELNALFPELKFVVLAAKDDNDATNMVIEGKADIAETDSAGILEKCVGTIPCNVAPVWVDQLKPSKCKKYRMSLTQVPMLQQGRQAPDRGRYDQRRRPHFVHCPGLRPCQ